MADLIDLFAGCPESDINLLGLESALSRLDPTDASLRARIVEAFHAALGESSPRNWIAAARAMGEAAA
jgi:hypothetical protein